MEGLVLNQGESVICPNCNTVTNYKEGMLYCKRCGASLQLSQPNTINRQEIVTKKSFFLSPMHIGLITFFILMGGIFYFASLGSDDSEEYSNVEEQTGTPEERELLRALQNFNQAKSDFEQILPQVEYVMNQYGYTQMGYITARQNNPSIMGEFERKADVLLSNYESVISAHRRCGQNDMANILYQQKLKVSRAINRIRGAM